MRMRTAARSRFPSLSASLSVLLCSVETEREDSSSPSGSRGAKCKTRAESGNSQVGGEAREEMREKERAIERQQHQEL